MSETNPPATPPKDDSKPARPRPAAKQGPAVGEVIQTSPGHYALVVGSEKTKHVHRGPDDQITDTVVREHPLVVDLPAARRHELDPHKDDE